MARNTTASAGSRTASTPQSSHPTSGSQNIHLVMSSVNKKTGAIPVSTSSAMTCPSACPLRDAGCYAKSGPVAIHWRKVTEGSRGVSVDAFAASIKALPTNQLWRHNQAGDLSGVGDQIDTAALATLVDANRRRRGFTYTHKPVTGDTDVARSNLAAIRQANDRGFIINASADTLAEADQLADLGLPTVVVLDAEEGVRHDVVTPQSRRVTSCPATYRDVTCQSCQLCQRQDRKTIVGFPAHGNGRRSALAAVRSL